MSAAQTRQKLQEYKASIEERLAKLARHVNHREDPLPQDFAEQAVEMENDETMVALEHELRDQLRDFDAALARVDEGRYGECTGCGEAISEQRLEALPATPLCISCAEKAGA